MQHIHPGESYTLRLAKSADLAQLPAIERGAAAQFPPSVFAGCAPGLQARTLAEQTLAAGLATSLLWVAALARNDEPVGFLLAHAETGDLHIEEMSVHPAHGRRGLGAALLRVACTAATDRGLPHVTLTTFEQIPWNGPFYERQGFIRLADLGPASPFAHVAKALRQEATLGLVGRIGMVKNLPHADRVAGAVAAR